MPYANIQDKRAYDRRYREKRAKSALQKHIKDRPLARLDLDALTFEDPADYAVVLKAAIETVCNDGTLTTMQAARTVGYLISVGLRVCELSAISDRLKAVEDAIEADSAPLAII